MKRVFSSGNRSYLTKIGIVLIMMALIFGGPACISSCAPVQPVQHNSLHIASTSGGSVTVPGEGDFTYDEGSVIHLKAVAGEGYQFVNWTDDVSDIANVNAAETTITMNDDYSITANFEAIPIVQYDLTISGTDGGSVTTPGEGTFPYNEGTVVDLVAVPDECYEFISWTGDTVANPDSPITVITMDDSKEVTANFAILRYNIFVASAEGGSVTDPGEETFAYDCGTIVDLVAVPDSGYNFTCWTGDIETITDVNAAETTIIVNGDYEITANFFQGWVIRDWYDLNAVRDNPDGNYLLMNDLDSAVAGYEELASETANDGLGWDPVGTLFDGRFTGNFSGQGYEVRDLFINRPDEYSVGLFGCIGADGVIENVGVDATIVGSSSVGGLVGTNLGTVTNSYSTGSVTGKGSISGAGGLVGMNWGTVTNSYSTSSVTGDGEIWLGGVGGLVGANMWGIVTNSYSTGNVTGETLIGGVGGLMGVNLGGTVTDSFWDTETSGLDVSAGGTGKTTAEMQNVTTFSDALWDITAVSFGEIDDVYIWNIVDDETYPFLSWEQPREAP